MREDGGDDNAVGPAAPMQGSPSLDELLPRDATWTPVSGGESESLMFHDATHHRYAKIVDAAHAADLVAERDRIRWLSGTDVPGARVLGWRTSDHGACLITSAVAGVPADRLDPTELAAAWPAITDTLVQLHTLPLDSCPFERAVDEMMTLARATVAEDRVHTEFLPRELAETPPRLILHGLERELPQRADQERSNAVVCHGDACLPNFVIDPATSQVTGLIDLGRLGRADPYADIALLLANARETWPDEATARRADEDFAARYGITLESDRQDFYLRLDPLTW